MMDRVFISYRRKGSSTFAAVLHHELAKEFSQERIFEDKFSIAPGSDFTQVIQDAIASTKVLLVLIDMNWTGHDDDTGLHRLTNENDYVRLEIRHALERGLHVIPVLLEGATMPSPTDLPNDIKAFATRNAFVIHPETVFEDIQVLIVDIKNKLDYKFEERTMFGSIERVIKDPMGTVRSGFTEQVRTLKKDFSYLNTWWKGLKNNQEKK